MLGKLVVLKFLHDVLMPDEHPADTVLLAEAQRQTATGTAVAYRVEITPALDDGVDKPPAVAVPQYISGFLPAYLMGIMRHRLQKNMPGWPKQNLNIYRMVAITKNPAAVAGANRHTLGDIQQFFSLGWREQVGTMQVATVDIGYPSYQPTEQGYPGALRSKHVEPEDPPAVLAVELQ
jgi:hypothetical protein